LFSGNIIEQIKSHYGGLVENPSMVMYVPLIALGVPIALWWAVKIIRKKK
jgi:hypothetical protein